MLSCLFRQPFLTQIFRPALDYSHHSGLDPSVAISWLIKHLYFALLHYYSVIEDSLNLVNGKERQRMSAKYLPRTVVYLCSLAIQLRA